MAEVRVKVRAKELASFCNIDSFSVRTHVKHKVQLEVIGWNASPHCIGWVNVWPTRHPASPNKVHAISCTMLHNNIIIFNLWLSLDSLLHAITSVPVINRDIILLQGELNSLRNFCWILLGIPSLYCIQQLQHVDVCPLSINLILCLSLITVALKHNACPGLSFPFICMLENFA